MKIKFVTEKGNYFELGTLVPIDNYILKIFAKRYKYLWIVC